MVDTHYLNKIKFTATGYDEEFPILPGSYQPMNESTIRFIDGWNSTHKEVMFPKYKFRARIWGGNNFNYIRLKALLTIQETDPTIVVTCTDFVHPADDMGNPTIRQGNLMKVDARGITRVKNYEDPSLVPLPTRAFLQLETHLLKEIEIEFEEVFRQITR